MSKIKPFSKNKKKYVHISGDGNTYVIREDKSSLDHIGKPAPISSDHDIASFAELLRSLGYSVDIR